MNDRNSVNISAYLSEVTAVAIPLCLGDPRDSNDGCHDRFEAAVKNLVPRRTLVIQTGGNESLPLCDLMLEVLKQKRPNWATRFLSFPVGWGTRSEIVSAFALINILSDEKMGNDRINTSSSEFRVIFASNKAHLPRIKWYVGIHNTSNLPVQYREAKHYFSFKDTVREWVGTFLIKIKDRLIGLKKVHEREMGIIEFLKKNLGQE